MSRPNQEAKGVYMLKDKILLKDEQLKRKKTDNENDFFYFGGRDYIVLNVR